MVPIAQAIGDGAVHQLLRCRRVGEREIELARRIDGKAQVLAGRRMRKPGSKVRFTMRSP